jgi:hypothetical protein
MSFTVYPIRSAPSRSGESNNGTRAMLGCRCGSGRGKRRKKIRIRSNQRKHLKTLTLDPDQRVQRRTYLRILPCHHRGRRRLGAHRSDSQHEPRAQRASAVVRVTGQRALSRICSTTAHSPSWGTRSPTRGPAAAPPPSSSCRHGRCNSLELARAGVDKQEKGKRKDRGEGRLSWSCVGRRSPSPSPATADHRSPAAANTLRKKAEEKGEAGCGRANGRHYFLPSPTSMLAMSAPPAAAGAGLREAGKETNEG